MSEHKVAWIAASKRVVTKTQLEAAKQWGAVTIWEPEHGDIWEFVNSLRPGDLVGVWTCDLLAPPLRKRLGETRKDTFRAVSEAIMEKGAKVYELKTGRDCSDRKELISMMLDARDAIANVSGSSSKGRPPKPKYTDNELQIISDAWFKKTHKNNEERLAAVKRHVERFTLADFYKLQKKLRAL